jgi:hypothetical protein
LRFDYYRSLKASERRTYDRSDAIARITLPRIAEHQRLARELEQALVAEDRAQVNRASQKLCSSILRALGSADVVVHVLARRPKNADGELHGLYTREADGSSQIEVWMRTSEQKKVVRFKTFLRTLLHELCHHLDFTLFRLTDTYHTEGFFKRESSLVRQLVPPARKQAAPVRSASPSAPAPNRQLSLFE